MAAAGIVSGLFPGPLNVSTTLGASTSIAQGLFIEMFLTAELIFVIFMFAAEKHKATFLAPVAIGLALFVSELPGVYYTGGSLNPARSFGPAVITSFPGYHWIYWIGPCFGALLAYGFYMLLKFGEYQTANPGQDFDDHEAELFHPPPDAATAEEVQRPNVAAEVIEKVASGGALSETFSNGERRSSSLIRGLNSTVIERPDSGRPMSGGSGIASSVGGSRGNDVDSAGRPSSNRRNLPAVVDVESDGRV